MNWLERELNWGADPPELRHLMGRIGELYVAMYTNGNLAEQLNEKGYDVVTKDNERISVETTRISGKGYVSFIPGMPGTATSRGRTRMDIYAWRREALHYK